MALTHGQKVLAAILGIGGTAGVAILVASKAQAAPPSQSVADITIEPLSLPQEGGVITVSGTTNLPAGTPVRILVDGKTVDDFTLTGETFSEQYDVSPNTSIVPKQLTVTVYVGSLVQSSVVIVMGHLLVVAPPSVVTPPVTTPPAVTKVSVTIHTGVSNASVAIGSARQTANSSGDAVFTLIEGSAYTVTASGTETVKEASGQYCVDTYSGSDTFTASNGETVDVVMKLTDSKCVSLPSPTPVPVPTPTPKHITHPTFTPPPEKTVTLPKSVAVTVRALFNGKPVADAAVLIGNMSGLTDTNGVATFALAPDTGYTADISARIVSSQTSVQECYDELKGSGSFRTGTSASAVTVSLASVNTVCVPFVSPVISPLILPKLVP